MKAEEQKILNESLSKLFKLDPETIASLYNDAGDLVDFSKILELDSARIAKYKSDSNDQFKRGVKETMSKFEKEVKEKYELESESVGVDLIDQLVVKKVEEAKVAGTKDITKHPEFIKLQVSIDKQLKDRDKEWETKFTEKDAEINKTKLFEKISKRAIANLKKRNPILPTDPVKAQYWEDQYLNELKKSNYMENGDDPIVLGEDNKPLQNAHGKAVVFDQFTNDIADRMFEFPVSEPRSNSGNKPPDPKNNGQSGFVPPKDEAEFQTRLKDPKIIPTERIQLMEWYNQK